MIRYALIAAASLGLAACTGFPITDDVGRAGNYQTAAGLNVIEWDTLQCNETLKLCGPENFRMIGGKQQEEVYVAMYGADGNKVFEYRASGVEAFEGQAFRAEVEQALAAEYGDVIPDVVDRVVSAAERIATGG